MSTVVLYPTACAEIRYLSYITEVSMGYADIFLLLLK
jgi:hypothetical protein